MRLPITPYGLSTALVFAGVFFALAVVAAALAWPYGLVFLLPALFVFYFFRDPERAPDDAGPNAIVSPADGKVVDIRGAEMPVLGGKATLVDIFLSVFDVHVNRAPLAGRVTDTLYRKGQFLNAMRGVAADVNESNLILIENERGKVVAVKQISGVIARRIVCGVGKGDEVRLRAAGGDDKVRQPDAGLHS